MVLSVRAQISIQKSDLPSGGSVYLLSNGDPTQISLSDLQIIGANQNWNFTLNALTQNYDTAYDMSQVPIVFRLAFLSSDYADRLAPDINLGLISFTNNYSFYNLTSSKLEQTGTGSYISGLPFPTFYNPKDVIYRLPVDFGNVDSSNSYFSASFPTIGSWKEGKKRINHADAWGTLKTPLGDKQVLRVRSELFYSDTVKVDTPFNLPAVPFTRHQVEYKWLAKSGGFPVLQVTTNVVGGNEVIAQVLYQDTLNTTAAQNVLSGDNVTVYPQPANGNVIIALSNDEKIESVNIYDVCGRLTRKIVGQNSPIINIFTSGIPAGLYPVTLQTHGKTYRAKISVIH